MILASKDAQHPSKKHKRSSSRGRIATSVISNYSPAHSSGSDETAKKSIIAALSTLLRKHEKKAIKVLGKLPRAKKLKRDKTSIYHKVHIYYEGLRRLKQLFNHMVRHLPPPRSQCKF